VSLLIALYLEKLHRIKESRRSCGTA